MIDGLIDCLVVVRVLKWYHSFCVCPCRSGVAIGKQVSPELARTLILSHMEAQLLLCCILNSTAEYRAWLSSYAQCLVDNSASKQRNCNQCEFELCFLLEKGEAEFVMNFFRLLLSPYDVAGISHRTGWKRRRSGRVRLGTRSDCKF